MAIDIEKTMQYLRDNAQQYAESKAARVYLQEFRKSKKALLQIEAEKLGIKTGQEREAYAYAHDEYIALLHGLQNAIEREEYLSIMMDGCRARIELYRTECANERAERKGYGA
jgi:hypothetical protein